MGTKIDLVGFGGCLDESWALLWPVRPKTDFDRKCYSVGPSLKFLAAPFWFPDRPTSTEFDENMHVIFVLVFGSFLDRFLKDLVEAFSIKFDAFGRIFSESIKIAKTLQKLLRANKI